jgi:hypothetical protein
MIHDVYLDLNVLVLDGHEVLVFCGSWVTRLSLFGVFRVASRDAVQPSQDIAVQLPSGAFRAALCIHGCSSPSWDLFETT